MRSPSEYNRQTFAGLNLADWAIVQARLDAWTIKEPVKPYLGKGRHCLMKLLNYHHKCVRIECFQDYPPNRFRCLDHHELWVHLLTRKFILTAHPYGLYEVEELETWCETNGLQLQVFEEGASWYLPTSTALIVVRGI